MHDVTGCGTAEESPPCKRMLRYDQNEGECIKYSFVFACMHRSKDVVYVLQVEYTNIYRSSDGNTSAVLLR